MHKAVYEQLDLAYENTKASGGKYFEFPMNNSIPNLESVIRSWAIQKHIKVDIDMNFGFYSITLV